LECFPAVTRAFRDVFSDLLDYLSRTQGISTILISSQTPTLENQIEERTHSSLYPQKIQFEPYTGEYIYDILHQRAQDSLTKQSLHREALTYIASTTSNTAYALHWLKTAAEQAQHVITETLTKEIQDQAYQSYTQELLQTQSRHHQLLYQAIKELDQEQETDFIQTGQVYERYQDLCTTYSETPLSNRRISDYIKHLETLSLITAEYFYGGTNGKTRHIRLTKI
jgi:Cdc6-like AAA superfamily ATPase